MKARLKDAHRTGIRVVTSSMTLIEAYHSKIRRRVWNWAVSGIVVEPATKDVADSTPPGWREGIEHWCDCVDLCADMQRPRRLPLRAAAAVPRAPAGKKN